MGSSSDSRIMSNAAKILDKFKINHDDQIISAHRTPELLQKYAQYAEKNNIKVIIAGAGGAAHLPGMISSFTLIPVIGVPILIYNDIYNESTRFSAFGGLDSLLSISEMPNGSAIVSVGINKSQNAALYAIKILANENKDLQIKLKNYIKKNYQNVIQESKKMKKSGIIKFIDDKLH